jgi:hypothetical protein
MFFLRSINRYPIDEELMSDIALMKKLQLKEGQRVLLFNAPEGYRERLADPAIETGPHGSFDHVHVFVKDSDELKRFAPQAFQAVKPGGILWIAYPKLSSGVKSDLTRDVGWEVVFQAGLRPVTQVAIDETWSALRFKPSAHETDQDLAAAQFAGAKAGLRPIYDLVLGAVLGFGEDIKVNPRQSYIALARKVQFAALKASTSTRLDLGLRLKAPPASERLETARGVGGGSINYMVSLTTAEQVDAELITWLREAYEGAG